MRRATNSSKEEAVPRLGSFEVMNRTIDIAQAALARHTLRLSPRRVGRGAAQRLPQP